MGNSFTTDAASGTSATYAWDDLKAQVGHYLGWGSSGWAASKESRIETLVKSGVTQFYWPPPSPQHPQGWSWSFLKPMGSLTTSAEENDLPAGFHSLRGPVMLNTTDYSQIELPVVNEARLRQLWYQSDNREAKPEYCAIRPKSTTGTAPQIWELLLHPQPDTSYTIEYPYTAVPNEISDTYPYAWGDAVHGNTILYSCLAEAEVRENNEKGTMWDKFMQRLDASITIDKKTGPKFIGYNRDWGINRRENRNIYWREDSNFTVTHT